MRVRNIVGFLALVVVIGCGGSGGNASTPSQDDLPNGCVTVGSISNSGGPITIIANCTNGIGNVTQTCFASGAAGEQPVPVPCDNGGSGQTVNGPTPTP